MLVYSTMNNKHLELCPGKFVRKLTSIVLRVRQLISVSDVFLLPPLTLHDHFVRICFFLHAVSSYVNVKYSTNKLIF